MSNLRVIPGGEGPPERQPWHRRADEDEAEHLLFLSWLHSADRAGNRLIPDSPGLAQQFLWSERADAYDQTHAMPTTPTGKAARGWQDLEEVFAIEARKLAKDVKARSGDRQLTVKEVLTLGAFMVDNKDAVRRILEEDQNEGEVDLKQLSDDELRVIAEGKKVLAKLGKGNKR